MSINVQWNNVALIRKKLKGFGQRYVKDKVVFVHEMKAYGGNGGMPPLILNVSTGRVTLLVGKEPLYALNRKQGWLQSQSAWLGEEIYLLTMLEIKPWCPGHPACSLVTTLGCTVELAHRENSTLQLVWFYVKLLVHGHSCLYTLPLATVQLILVSCQTSPVVSLDASSILHHEVL